MKNQFTKLFSDDECVEIINFIEKKEDWNLKIQLDENEEIKRAFFSNFDFFVKIQKLQLKA